MTTVTLEVEVKIAVSDQLDGVPQAVVDLLHEGGDVRLVSDAVEFDVTTVKAVEL